MDEKAVLKLFKAKIFMLILYKIGIHLFIMKEKNIMKQYIMFLLIYTIYIYIIICINLDNFLAVIYK